MERSGGMVTGSHERNELVRVRHGSDSRVGVSGFVSTLFFFFFFCFMGLLMETMFCVFSRLGLRILFFHCV